ncbi:hypothetical protein PGT21_024228 [Puccinia graminis f. sp. tritici]|uniref:Uncharacterized protein n=1 Tax=Puccinia graminis f. sp. tritici TaxID=56615 RepID=A0A5B0R1F7_PUCGR|nr:hypothetical protein PGT21_024228 [Puccinia graminis f. sp. tritici]
MEKRQKISNLGSHSEDWGERSTWNAIEDPLHSIVPSNIACGENDLTLNTSSSNGAFSPEDIDVFTQEDIWDFLNLGQNPGQNSSFDANHLVNEEPMDNQNINGDSNKQANGDALSQANSSDWKSKAEEPTLKANSENPMLDLTFPESSMNQNFLSNILKDFKKYINKIHKTDNYGYRKLMLDHRMDQFPSVVFKLSRKNFHSSIWILDKESGLHQGIDSLKEKFESLIKWLIFINTAVLRRISGLEPSWNELTSHTKMLEWLFEESFEPENSIPVLGKIQNVAKLEKAQHFGPIQNILIDYLSSGAAKKDSLKTGITIIEFWYKHFEFGIWEQIPSQGNESSKDKELKSVVIDAMNCQMKVYQERYGDGHPDKIEDEKHHMLGDMEIPRLEQFPLSMQPGNYKGNLENLEAESIFQRIPYNMRLTKNNQIEIKDFPVILLLHLDQDHKPLCRVSFVNPNGDIIKPKKLQKILNTLLFHLKLCHKVLIDFLETNRVPTLENALTSFNAWFLETLTKNEDGCLPIIGNVDRNLDEYYPSQFDEVQRYLIENYFTHKLGPRKVIQTSLAVIQYWYKNYHPNIFIRFKEFYWNAMIEILGQKLSKAGAYCLRQFDSDGNFIGRKQPVKLIEIKHMI